MKHSEITKIWAYLAIDKDAKGQLTEGLTAFTDTRTGRCMPLIASDQCSMESLKPIAEYIAKSSGRVVKLVEFSVRKEIATILPNQGCA